MQEKAENDEKLTDFRGCIESLVKEETPELSQEEAIMAYTEGQLKSKKRNNFSSDDDNQDDDHLKRIKEALLESLRNVNKLEKQLFGEREFQVDTINVNKKEDFYKAKGKGPKIEENILNELKGKEREE